MKWVLKFSIIVVLLLLSLVTKENTLENKSNLRKQRIVFYKEIYKNNLLNTFIWQESRGDAKAFNKSENAAGILQIRPIMVREANSIVGYEKFKNSDRFDKNKSIEIFWTVQNYHNPKLYFDQAAHFWNAGQPVTVRWGSTEKYRKDVAEVYVRIIENRNQLNKN